ncbi:MAG: hypothetical protein ACREP9_09095 [Candidatus Dormibacteraceae bacterium]
MRKAIEEEIMIMIWTPEQFRSETAYRGQRIRSAMSGRRVGGHRSWLRILGKRHTSGRVDETG